MVTLGIDAHKRTHTVVAVDEPGRQLGARPRPADQRRSSRAVALGERFGAERLWAIEDCRHLSRRLEAGPARGR